MKHKHHIIPKHMGGTDEQHNIIELSIEEHAESHRKLYEIYGLKDDYLAWKGLLGLLTKQEIILEILKENGRRLGLSNKGRSPWCKGHTKETNIIVKRISDKLKNIPKSEEHKKSMKKPKNNSDKMGKYERTDEIKEKTRKAAINQFSSPEARRINSEKQKIRDTCPKCGFESNKSNVTTHKKNCL